jgi:hypothetical protein
MGIGPLELAIAVLRAPAGSFVPSQREFSSIPAALGFDRHFRRGSSLAGGAGQNALRSEGEILVHDDRSVGGSGAKFVRNPAV